MAMPDVPLRLQLACAKRELALRICLYPHLVAHGTLLPRTAMRELAQMRAIIATLKGLVEAERGGEGQGEMFEARAGREAEEP
jgi:hypothetical protein